jgi:HEAT repeat protein
MLARYPTHPQAEAAVERLLGSDPTLVREASTEIEILGESAMPVLYRSLDSAAEPARLRILKSAAGIGTPEELLLGIIDKTSRDEAANVRRSTAFYAGQFPQLSAELGPILITLAEDPEPSVRAAALSSLGGYPSSTQLTADTLVNLVRDPNVIVAASAASLAIRRPEPEVQIAAREALPHLARKIQDPVPAHRAAIIHAIGHYGTSAKPSIPTLKLVLEKDKVPELRLQAAIALMRINTPASRKLAVPALKSFANSKEEHVRVAAQSALSLLPSK